MSEESLDSNSPKRPELQKKPHFVWTEEERAKQGLIPKSDQNDTATVNNNSSSTVDGGSQNTQSSNSQNNTKNENSSNGTENQNSNSEDEEARKQRIRKERLAHLTKWRNKNEPTPIKEDDDVYPDEVEGTIIALAIDKINQPLKSAIAKQIHSWVKEVLAQGQSVYNLKQITDMVTKRVDAINEEYRDPRLRSESIDVNWNYSMQTSAYQGRRSYMEDRFIMFKNLSTILQLDPPLPVLFCGIYDGHGGENAANYTRRHMHVNIARDEYFGKDMKKAINNGFLKTDRDFCRKATKVSDKSGCTATVILISGDMLYAANVGDSSAIISLGPGKQPITLTFDHKPSDESEMQRVKSSGGAVFYWSGGWRVNGTMAVSRSIGDEPMANVLIAEPFMFERKLTGEEEFIVVATDGLWDVMKGEEVVDFVHQWIEKHKNNRNVNSMLSLLNSSKALDSEGETNFSGSSTSMSTFGTDNNSPRQERPFDLSSELLQEAKRRNTADNVTVSVVFLK